MEELIGRSSCSVLAGPNCLPLFNCSISLSTPLSGSSSHFSLSGFVCTLQPLPPSLLSLPHSLSPPRVSSCGLIIPPPPFLQPPAGPGLHDLSVEGRLPMSQADKAANYPTLHTPEEVDQQTGSHTHRQSRTVLRRNSVRHMNAPRQIDRLIDRLNLDQIRPKMDRRRTKPLVIKTLTNCKRTTVLLHSPSLSGGRLRSGWHILAAI